MDEINVADYEAYTFLRIYRMSLKGFFVALTAQRDDGEIKRRFKCFFCKETFGGEKKNAAADK